jgi:serine/threonine protein kinase/WD40 repeat protein
MTAPAADVKSLFGKALELATPADRAAFLDEACAANPDLRSEVEGLLQALEKAGNFMNQAAPGATVAYPPLPERPGTVIGPYKLLEQIGEGGMGTVFLAEQTEPVRRKVALKVIKPGMDSAQVIARFEAERQALALMDHPNIARVLDAGTTDSGRPFFVMELVKGTPLTDFCDQNRLTPRERLELFVPVCQAVQHAHQKGIIHRDLKPSNVLVALYDGQPVPKVIDFGIAKATDQRLTEKTLFTKHGQIIGTFEYMSPEQATLDTLDVDTRSDVYSLGVLLYELLTGTTPLEKERLRQAALGEILRLIREEEPLRPSARLSASGGGLPMIAAYRKTETQKLPALVRGDLDWIVMKGLDKDRSRRYETASALAADVRRYLSEEPVEARPPSAGYRLRKFVKRNRGPVVAAAVLLLALVAGVIGTTWGMARAVQSERIAREEEQKARRERDDAKAAREAVRRSLYVTAMNLIPAAWEVDNLDRVVELLEQQIPGPNEEDLRGFEWHYWDRLCHAERRTLPLDGSGQDATLSSDGSRVATGVAVFDDKGKGNAVIKVREVASGRELASWTVEVPEIPADLPKTLRGLAEKTGPFATLAFSRDGRRLAAVAGPLHFALSDKLARNVIVWNVATGKELFRKGIVGRMVAISPDGKRLAALEGDPHKAQLKVWDISAPDREPTILDAPQIDIFNGPSLPDLRFSPDGTRLAGIMNPGAYEALVADVHGKVRPAGEIRLWDVATGKTRMKINAGQFSALFTALAFSPDGRRLAALATRQNQALLAAAGSWDTYLWDGAAGDELKLLRKTPITRHGLTTVRALSAVAFTPDGGHLAVWRPGTQFVRFLDAATGAEREVLKGYEANVQSIAFRPDGTRVFTAGNAIRVAEGKAVLKEWDLPTGGAPATGGVPERFMGWAAWSRDGKRVAVADVPPSVLRIFGGRDDKRVPVADDPRGTVSICDRTGKVLRVFHENIKKVHHHIVSPDFRLIVSIGFKGALEVWETDTGNVRFTRKPDLGAKPANLPGRGFERPWFAQLPQFSPDSRLLVLPAPDGMKIVSVADFKELFAVGGASSVSFSPDGRRLVAVSLKGLGPPVEYEMHLWDVGARRLNSSYPFSASRLGGVTFSPDSRWFAALAPARTDLIVRDAATGKEQIALKGAGRSSCVFSPDGTRLLVWSSGSGRGRRPGVRSDPGETTVATVWDLTTGKILHRLRGHSGSVRDMAFSPDGKRIASAASESVRFGAGPGEIKLWDATTGRELLTLKAVLGPGGLSFSPDGNRLFLRVPRPDLSGGVRETIWDATPRAEQPKKK